MIVKDPFGYYPGKRVFFTESPQADALFAKEYGTIVDFADQLWFNVEWDSGIDYGPTHIVYLGLAS